VHPIFASLEAADAGNDFLAFLTKLSQELKRYARQAIDSPEERKSLEAGVMAYYDKYFSPHVPAFLAVSFRQSVLSNLDSALLWAAGGK
jgi:hypothetical protein